MTQPPPTILAIDIGNSNITCGLGGLSEQRGWDERWRLSTAPARTADEYELSLRRLVESRAGRTRPPGAAVICSVVPELTTAVATAVERLVGRAPLIVGPGTATGMDLRYRPPGSLGPDRIADAIAARERYGAPVITVDFGSATTFNAVDAGGRFVGGAIAPGLQTSAQALADAGARLRRVVLDAQGPPPAVGRTTAQAMRSGLALGFAGLVRGLLARLEGELATEGGAARPAVVATGGLVYHIAGLVPRIDHVDADLLLNGLRLIASRNLPS